MRLNLDGHKSHTLTIFTFEQTTKKMLLHIGLMPKLAFHIVCVCVHRGSELRCKLLAHLSEPCCTDRLLITTMVVSPFQFNHSRRY